MLKANRMRCGVLVLVFSALFLSADSRAQDNDVSALREEIVQLQRKVAGLEARLSGSGQTARSVANVGSPLLDDPDNWDPFGQMDILQRRMQALFGAGLPAMSSSGSLLMPARMNAFDPDYDIKETDKSYVLTFDLPGMDKSRINVEVKGVSLIISGERSTESKEEQPDRFYRQQRSFGYFSRSIPLPDNAKGESVQAKYENGVLTVTIGKKEASPKAQAAVKKIEVK